MLARFFVALVALALLSGCTRTDDSSPSSTAIPTAFPTAIPTATISAPTVIPTTAPTAIAETHTIKGNLLIQPGFHYETYDDRNCLVNCGTEGAPCTGIGAYKDLRTGTQITVRDNAGQIIAVGELKTGSLELWKDAPYWGRCRLPLEIPNVPTSSFYTLSIGTRQEITYTHDQLVSLNWRLSLTLGDPDW